MPILVRKVQNNIRSNEKCFGKYYGRVAIIGEVGIEELANLIQENCTLKRSDILAVLSELGPTIKQQLQKSYRVRLPYLGIFKMSMSSEGVEQPEDYNLQKHVKSLKVKFFPETSVEQGHRIKELIRGARLSLLPKNVLDRTIDDIDNQDGLDNQHESTNGGAEVVPDNQNGDVMEVTQP